ncbi:hypothetical protein [Peterkaempfera sp. SMS 1(5)a]|uniref:hypothetical protein n=1 Tax=Peterkaempfera podocarpi TaxID=3232308 RepID=UPI00366D1C7E
MSETTPRGARVLGETLTAAPAPADPDDLEELADQDETEAPELDIEAPEADAQEQHQELRQHRDDPDTGRAGYDANPADATEQRRVVELDEDDYR